MRLIKALALLLFFCFTTNSFAANYKLKSEELLTLTVSDSGPSRIFYEGQKITDVFFYPEEAAKVVLHKSGALFVVPLPSQKQVYITLISEEGVTQDLKLNFVKKQPEPIKLQSQTEQKILTSNSIKYKGAQK